MQHKQEEVLLKDIFVGYIVSEMLVENRKLLTLIIYGTGTPL